MAIEIHVTLDAQHLAVAETITALHPKFHVSRIDGDPVLGKGPRVYLTAHAERLSRAEQWYAEVEGMLFESKVEPLRVKFEHIIYDTKTGVNLISRPTAKGQALFTYNLKSSGGLTTDGRAMITPEQYGRILAILEE